jgi:hypothetical protein
MDKPANTSVQVWFFRTRNPLEWKARIECGKERFYVGPGSIRSVLNNVANFVQLEATYTDVTTNSEEEIAAARKPAKDRQTRLRARAEKERELAAAQSTDVAVLACEEEYGR